MASDEILEIPQVPRRRNRWMIFLLLTFFLGAFLGIAAVQLWHSHVNRHQLSDSFADVVEKVSPSVVSVVATRIIDLNSLHEGNDLYTLPSPEDDKRRKSRGYGSGFVIDRQGTIATNFHVVEAARLLTVRLWDGREYAAELAGGDRETDIALIRVQSPPPLTPALLGDSDRLRAGDWVMAMGNPFNYSHSVTVGVVSARQRLIDGLPFEQFIQTDAAINFGNSGGPLINLEGQVVGMATAISTRGRSIGFAIPINLAKTIFQQLAQRGKVVRGYLGIRPAVLTEELNVLLKANAKSGIVVEDVSPESGAALAGIQRYDIISGINGKAIQDRQDFFSKISCLQPGAQAQIDVLRDGKSYSAQVMIQERAAIPAGKGENAVMSPENESRELAQQPWGIAVQDLPERSKPAAIAGLERRGVVVVSVLPLSAAVEVDLLPGDVILELNRHPINSLKDYQDGISKTQRDRSLVLLILRPPAVTRLLVLKKPD